MTGAVHVEAAIGARADVRAHNISFREAGWVWARIAALSFRGPAGQIAVMHRVLVDEKRWIGETRFLHALNYCMLLPGPEAQQLAVYIGWLLHKTRGGLVAGTLFVLPGMVAIMALSWIYAIFGNVGAVQAIFFGLKAAVLAIVLEAVARVGKRALKNNVMVALAAGAFVALFFFQLPFPLIILTAAVIGFIGGRAQLTPFLASNGALGLRKQRLPGRPQILFYAGPRYQFQSESDRIMIVGAGSPSSAGNGRIGSIASF